MRRLLVPFAIGSAAAGLALLGASLVNGQTEPDALESGARLYQAYCAACHGVSGRGGGPVAASLVVAPPDLTRLGKRYGLPLPREQLARYIDGRADVAAHGPREMPVWGEVLYPGESEKSGPREAARSGTIRLILDYLESIQVQPAG
jgi:mono/diheme cytochrome c family protein